MTARRFAAGVLLVAVTLTGCGKADRSCPVTGKVLVNARPAAGLYVVFHAAGDPKRAAASARADKDGAFTLRVPEPGDYAVTAFWPSVVTEQGDTVEGADAFKGRFRDAERPATRVTITRGENALAPIELKFDFGRP